MLKYLVIVLDDTSVSYCHYAGGKQSKLMPLEILKEGIMFAMKNNLKIQYLLPQEKLPEEYLSAMALMDHDCIGAPGQEDLASVIVCDGFDDLEANINSLDESRRYLIRCRMHEFMTRRHVLESLLDKGVSANVVFTDIEKFTDKDIAAYKDALEALGSVIMAELVKGKPVNTNLLTDRIVLDAMNNCGAGEVCMALAPDGKFYPCPAFYFDGDSEAVLGNVTDGIADSGRRLYTLKRAPLCKRCDAYQCKRCVWLNKRLTYEVNIPSRQQCVISHIERNASRKLLQDMQERGILREKAIPQIDYLDPFDNYKDS